jgi:NADPH:quinone reductase-like Zn-dependent oxidoreductase
MVLLFAAKACALVCSAVCLLLLLTRGRASPLHLQPGDCVIMNAANSTVGQLLLQLCILLRLRAVAVISDKADFDKTALWLRALGASEVLPDQGSLKVRGWVRHLGCGSFFFSAAS